MVRVEVGKQRSTIISTANGTEIVIPSRKNIFVILFLGFWLLGWLFGEIMVSCVLLFPIAQDFPDLFGIVWLVGWTVCGFIAIYIWLWNIIGREVIRINSQELAYKREIFGLGRSKEYDISHVKNMRTLEGPSGLWGGYWGVGSWGFAGTVAFDYGHRTIKICLGIDEAEAQYIINQISQTYGISKR